MARMNDVGGMQGFGAVDITDDPRPFHADWEARVVGLLNALGARELFTTDEFRDVIESLPPAEYLAMPYYQRWFHALCVLLERKGVLDAGELASLLDESGDDGDESGDGDDHG
ncbi:Nitrile hydratase beta subunit domain containing protein [Actinobacteria bacterium OK074]|nr:Nitrile hydratase beta subunit domain containing protein [Actinobacteria bacterium OK074]